MRGQQPERVGAGLRGQAAGQVQVQGPERRHPDDQPELVDRHDHAGRVGGVGHRHPHQHRRHQRAERGGHGGSEHPEHHVEGNAAAAAAVQHHGQGQQRGRHPGEPPDGQPRADARGQTLPVEAHHGERGRRRGEREPRAQRRVTEPALQVQRQREEQAAEVVMTANSATMPSATPGSRSTRPGTRGDPPRAASLRSTAAKPANSSTLPPRQAQPQAGQCSGWPRTSGTTRASTATARREQAGQVQAAAGLGAPGGQLPRARHQQHRADRHVHQEHRPPARAEQVSADQQAADDLPDDHAAGQHRRVGTHRPRPGTRR